jgi:hypothetical protein
LGDLDLLRRVSDLRSGDRDLLLVFRLGLLDLGIFYIYKYI